MGDAEKTALTLTVEQAREGLADQVRMFCNEMRLGGWELPPEEWERMFKAWWTRNTLRDAHLEAMRFLAAEGSDVRHS